MLLYYITDRRAFPGSEAEKRTRLLAKIAEAARCGVHFIQLREKDLSPRELECLARQAMQVVRDNTPIESDIPESLAPNHSPLATRLLINSRTDIALACGADGVHLTSTDVSASDARAVAAKSSSRPSLLAPRPFLVSVSCHTIDEVRLAEAHGADFAVFAPVFEKSVVAGPADDVPAVLVISSRSPEDGLAALRAACQSVAFPRNVEGVGGSAMPVLALGGIALENARACAKAGAAGVAAVRLFQENDIAEVVRRLR